MVTAVSRCWLSLPRTDGILTLKILEWVDVCAPEIEAGKLQLFSFDTIDAETWSDEWGDPGRRMALHEKWFHYVIDELYPRMMEINGSGQKAMATGCSMGAYHAANFFLPSP